MRPVPLNIGGKEMNMLKKPVMKFRCEYRIEAADGHEVKGEFDTNDGYFPAAEKVVQTMFGPTVLITHCKLAPLENSAKVAERLLEHHLPEPATEDGPKAPSVACTRPVEEMYIDCEPPTVLAEEAK